MRVHGRRLPRVLTALGALLALLALVMLFQTRGALQYCVLTPDAGEKGDNLIKLCDAARKLDGSMKDALKWVALGGDAGKLTLSAGSASEEACVFAIGEGWLEVWPRFLIQGRRIGESELEQGARVAMLDEKLAFRLFGEELPEDAEVKLNGERFRVVGTVRHAGTLFGGRGVGDRCPYDAYVPLTAAARAGMKLETLTLSALPGGSAGAAQLFEEAARSQWLAGGRLIDLDKEAMRRTILPRVVLLIAGLYALVGLFKRMTRLAAGWFAGFREALKGSYFKRLIGRLAGIVALALLGYGALIGATYLLMAFSVQPLYTFPEWVPENIVEWSSITRVFWNLTAAAAEPVRVATRELRVIEFWGGVLRWGIVLALLGVGLRGNRRQEQETETGTVRMPGRA